jgi:hypothetical protein
MKKALLLILVVGAAALTIGVATAAKPKPKPALTIALSQPVVTFGGSVTVSGSVDSHQPGQKVDVLGKQYGQATFAPLATVDTATDGAWTYTASPTIQTTYEAKWLTTTSRPVAVKVQPQLTLTQVSLSSSRTLSVKGTFSVKATANRPFAGKFVLVQRLAPSGTTQLKKVVLGNDSSATFTIRVQTHNSRLRAVMPASQTQPGYIAAQSAVLTVHR